MKSLYLILSLLLFSGFSLKAEGNVYERVYVHTDKNCYVAGEDILLKFYLINNNFQPSGLSKTGYVEICDTVKPQMQLKIALKNGQGAGDIKIPTNIPSGVYMLSGYTRYMRNEGENVFFKKQIAIVNAGQGNPDPKRFEIVEKYEDIQTVQYAQPEENNPANLLIKTGKSEYGNREKVTISLDNLPNNATDLVISVSRNDSIAFLPEINKQDWLKQVKDTFHLSNQWLPEYEGHIITGRILPESHDEQFLTNISFTGKEIFYINGQNDYQNGTVSFYTADIYGNRQIVTSIVSPTHDKVPYRVDLQSPFSESLPAGLPVLQIYPNEKQVLERYIAVQIEEKMKNDSISNPIQSSGYYNLEPVKTYDLDQYRRFETIGETILEFIPRLRVTKIKGKKVISAFMDDEKRFSSRTLVLLDGVPVYNQEDVLQYNPMYIKTIDIYDGRYTFSGEVFEGIVSFITREGNLPFFQLGESSQLFNYDCPQLPPAFEIPDYSNAQIKNSRKPDFRHTLYWNPFVESTKGKPVNLSFYTSDLCGEFKVTVEGVTSDGKMIKGNAYFQVK